MGAGEGGDVDTTHERFAAFLAVLLFTVSLLLAQLITARRRLRIRSESVRTKRAHKESANLIMRWAARAKDIDIMDSYIGADEEDQDEEFRGGSTNMAGMSEDAGWDADADLFSRATQKKVRPVSRWPRMMVVMSRERWVRIASTLVSMIVVYCLSNSQLPSLL